MPPIAKLLSIFPKKKKKQAKRKPYTIEYFYKLNIPHHQVYRTIKRFESGISHKQQLGTGRRSHHG